MVMRIVSITARTVRWPIAGIGAARGRAERAAVIVEARSEAGAIGLGEAAPLPGMSIDTLVDAEHAIAALARQVPITLAEPVDVCALAARIAGGSPSTAEPSPAARFAIETALLDAMAHERRVTLASLLAQHRAALASLHTSRGDPASPLDDDATARRSTDDAITPLSTQNAAAIARPPAMAPDASAQHATPARHVLLAAVVDDPEGARRAFAAGIRCFKIKLTADDPVRRATEIAAAAPGARLRIDANRSWPIAEVADRLTALAALPVDYVEEPCRDAHRLLASPLAVKLALDESLAELTSGELTTALRSPGLAAIVLKPALVGGLSRALALAAQAQHHGVAAIASHALEGPIGTAACAELALALGGSHAAGLAAHAALVGWAFPVEQLAADHVRTIDRPGLGFVHLDLDTAIAAAPSIAHASHGHEI